MKNTLFKSLQKILKNDQRLIAGNTLLRNKIIELTYKEDENLIQLLLSDNDIKEYFFSNINDIIIFDKEKFVKFINNKSFLPDSFTSFKNKIGLTVNEKYIKHKKEVVLSWPYKDCILEGGQTKEETKRDEIFWNEILAPNKIDRLLDPKILVNFKKIDQNNVYENVEDITCNDSDNYLIKGNNLLVLHSLKRKFSSKINSIYIDPPFNTGNDSFNYNDKFNHSTWLTFMKNRLEISKQLLSNDGNIFIHIDKNEAHYLKILCDEIFGRENFVEEIIWAYGSPSGGRAGGAKPVNIHDYILHYAKNYSNRKQNKIYTSYSDDYINNWFKYSDEDQRKYRTRMRGKDEDGNPIYEKQYLDESKGLPLTTVWNDIKQVYADPRAYKENQAKHTELIRDFSGQKPEQLIKRIIEMSTDPGDLVMDFCMGTGTTCAVAHKMNRQYIGVEQMDYIKNYALKRLKKVIAGDPNGISEDFNWEGGGSFIYAELMKWNDKYLSEVKEADSSKELIEIWNKVKKEAFLSYKVDPEIFEENIDEFNGLNLKNQKQFLLECLDKNHLFANLSELYDEDYNINSKTKELNNKFYEGGL